MLKVIIKKPNEYPIVKEIEDSLESLQKQVDGYIEVVSANENSSVLMVLNEEGKLKGLPYNFDYGDNDYIVGNCIFVGNDAPEFRSLTEEEIEEILGIFE